MALAIWIAFLAVGLGLAWGPGFHASCAQEVLRRLGRRRRRSEAAACVLADPEDFLYGTIAADLIHLKRYGGAKNGCHDWSVEERLVALSTGEADRAFALGCVAHLAADVVAHNWFVPFHRVHGFPPQTLGHAYWEARADGTVPEATWEAVVALRRRRSLRRHDRRLHEAVPRRAFSLASNRWLFRNVTLAGSRSTWRNWIAALKRRPPRGTLVPEHLDACRRLSLRHMARALEAETRIELVAWDPLGREALRAARRLRRELLAYYGDRCIAEEPSRKIAWERFGL